MRYILACVVVIGSTQLVHAQGRQADVHIPWSPRYVPLLPDHAQGWGKRVPGSQQADVHNPFLQPSPNRATGVFMIPYGGYSYGYPYGDYPYGDYPYGGYQDSGSDVYNFIDPATSNSIRNQVIGAQIK